MGGVGVHSAILFRFVLQEACKALGDLGRAGEEGGGGVAGVPLARLLRRT
jgi:hypothetical protein